MKNAHHPLIDPKNDFVFKKLFADAPHLLAALINAVCWPKPAVRVVEVLNPEITADDLAGKCIVLDILAQDEAGKRYNIEMQVNPYRSWGARSTYYLARTLSRQIVAGQDYAALKPVLGIHLLDFNLFNAPEHSEHFFWRFEFRDYRFHEVCLGDELGLTIIELPKADAWASGISIKQQPDINDDLKNWVQFLKHSQENRIMSQISDPSIQEAMTKLEDLSTDPRVWAVAESRFRAQMDERAQMRLNREAALSEGRAEGLAIGLAEGHAEGLVEGQAEALERLIRRKFGTISEEQIASVKAAPAERLLLWLDRLLEARSPEDIFGT